MPVDEPEPSILKLPNEIIEQILLDVYPLEVACCRQVSAKSCR
jgi:hypothetical protein